MRFPHLAFRTKSHPDPAWQSEAPRSTMNESLTADGMRLRLHDLRVTVGDEIRVSARLR